MKKILTHLTGIVFLTTILVAGGCAQEPNPDPLEEKGRIKIYCKAYKEGEVMNFEIYDSTNDTVIAIPSSDDPAKLVANLVTVVKAGKTVLWKWDKDSEIKKFVNIGPETPGQIITGNARRVILTGNYKYKIPGEATTGQESYYIEFNDLEGNPYKIDPYLKIR